MPAENGPQRHCFVRDPDGPWRPGPVIDWRQDTTTGTWSTYVSWVVDDEPSGPVVVTQWLPRDMIRPA